MLITQPDPRCPYCGRPVIGSFVQGQEGRYHPACTQPPDDPAPQWVPPPWYPPNPIIGPTVTSGPTVTENAPGFSVNY